MRNKSPGSPVGHALMPTLIREPEPSYQVGTIREPPDPPALLDLNASVDEVPRARGRGWVNEGLVVFLAALAVYLIVAILLDFKYRSFNGDAVSRMANGFYILYSRDAHLAAVGFVWTPLQSMGDLLFLLGNDLWPALSHNDLAGSLVSSLAMAGAVYQILAALREWKVSLAPRLVLTTFFALNPMILFYAGNGMSEGLYLFTLIASTRYLLRWIRQGDLRSLAYSGVALGFSYLTRNEAFLGAVAGTMVVGAVSYWRSDGDRPLRIRTAMADLTIFAIPPFTAAAGWAITSYVITGQFFGQFSSLYGNSAQERYLTHRAISGRAMYEVQAIESLAPLLAIVLIASVIVALRRRDARILAPLAVLGGALGFDVLAYLANTIENFYRYFIVAVPLEVMLVGALVAAVQTPGRIRAQEVPRTRSSLSRGRFLRVLGGVMIVLVVMIPATTTTASAMFNPNIGAEQEDALGFIFHAHPTADDLLWKARYPHILALGSYFAALRLPDGDIVADNFDVCLPQLLTTISQPKVFVIPNDRDFQRVLADPITFHVHYILEANPAQVPNTSINVEYPRLWTSRSGFTKMVHNFPSRDTCPAYRLFRVLHHSDQETQ
jgi:hypothetical protein